MKEKSSKIATNSTRSTGTKFSPSTIEPKWQAKWEHEKVYQPDLEAAKSSSVAPYDAASHGNSNLGAASNGQKLGTPFYNLMMFPYPSAEGLHVGSMYAFGGADVFGRFKRMQGYDVLEPIGLDGFGIHSENHAIKTNSHPIDHAKRTQENFYRQLHAIGNSYAWDNKLETYDLEYYRWTQWIFVQLFKSNLAYRKKSPVNYCISCKTVLSDEQVIDGACERCSSIVEKRNLEQWYFRITNYAEPLLNNIKDLDWADKVRSAQTNWIGKKEGINITYVIEGTKETVTVFTTRPDTNYGATFIAIAPEHPLAVKIATKEQRKAVESYIKDSLSKSDIERVAEGKEKTGVFTGVYAINPLTNYKMPVWISDFVLGGFGTGALVGVPGHDKRDFQFAQKFGLPIIRVVTGADGDTSAITDISQVQEEAGEMINSGVLNGMNIHDATHAIMDYMEKEGYGKKEVSYHLRDWLISRQRYWGPPIPMVFCEHCKKRKMKILLLHGLSGSSKENWFPWFKEAMEERGYDVLIPDLPDPDNPTLEEWVTALEKLSLKKEDRIFVVAHSLGAPAAIAYIRKNRLPIEKLLLVAPTGNEQGEETWRNLEKAGCSKEGIKKIQTFNKTLASIDEVADLIAQTTMYLSDNDPYIPLTIEKSYAILNPKVCVFANHGHFNKSAGVTELPDILNEFPMKENAGWVPVSEKDLPVELPYLKDFKPLGTGKSPLASSPEFYKTTCPACGSDATRETDVSDTFLDSSWYFLRYLATDLKHIPFPMSHNMSNRFRDATAEEKGKAAVRTNRLPVTMYIGGAEHSVLHLLYSRFITMALKDMGFVDFEEPFSRFYAHGLIIKDGAKMSKSKGNIINPDEYIAKYGADTLRIYLQFLGPFNQGGDFRDSGIDGMSRFLKRVWNLLSKWNDAGEETLSKERLKLMHETIKGVTDDLENLRYNTAIAKLMIYYNALSKQDAVAREEVKVYLQLLAPFAPHMTEELWEMLGFQEEAAKKGHWSIHRSLWPSYDAKYIVEESLTIAIQVNGKLRGTVTIPADEKGNQQMVEQLVSGESSVQKFLEGNVKKIIYIPGKIINYVVV